MSDDSGAERYRDYFKFITTVNGVALVVCLTLRRDAGLDPSTLGMAAVVFALSALICLTALHALTRDPDLWDMGAMKKVLGVANFLTGSATVALIFNAFLSL